MASFFTVWRFDLWKCARGSKTCLVLPCRRLALKLHAQVRFYKVRYFYFIYFFKAFIFRISDIRISGFFQFSKPIFQTPFTEGAFLVERGDTLRHADNRRRRQRYRGSAGG